MQQPRHLDDLRAAITSEPTELARQDGLLQLGGAQSAELPLGIELDLRITLSSTEHAVSCRQCSIQAKLC